MRYLLDMDPRINLDPHHEMTKSLLKLPVYVPFVGEFSEESASKFRENLETAENMALKSGQDVIPVTIDSYGGSVYALLGMVDAINACSVKVSTIVESKAMSCGAVLLSCGAEGYRFVGPNATVMIHTVSSVSFGKIDEIKAGTDEANRLNEKLFKLMAKNCGHKNENYFLDILQGRRMADWFLDAKQCVEHNLANKVHLPTMKVKLSCDVTFG